MLKRYHILSSILILLASINPVFASEFDGASLSLLWGLPFASILLSIAIMPNLAGHIWHHHFGKITAFWTALFIIPFIISFGFMPALETVVHAIFAEYVPFILLLLALYSVSGGILVQGNLHGSPKLNTMILALGTILASIMGTTGAAMLLIRPLLRANDNRKHCVHVVVFFIFLVANIGGGLTPLGDPPLFLGFLKGVTFGWTFIHMLPPVLISSGMLLTLFFFMDRYFYTKEDEILPVDPTQDSPVQILGKANLVLLAAIIASVLLSGIWKPETSIDVLGTHIELQNITRDLLLIIIAIISLKITPRFIREGNEFNWDPIVEVGKLFLGIFITIAPVIAILKAGEHGHLSSVISLVQDSSGNPINYMYFWITGSLSAFLDNAPTYLVFFNMAHGDAHHLMTEMPLTLQAISMGAVLMGAMSYIGNAPNFMVKSIAEHRGIKMPSFFGYMKWSISILIPTFIILDLVCFIWR